MNASSTRFRLVAAATATFALASLANVTLGESVAHAAPVACPIEAVGQPCDPGETVEMAAAGDDAGGDDDGGTYNYGYGSGYGYGYGNGGTGNGGTCVLATTTTTDANGETLSTTSSSVCLALSTTYCDPQAAGGVCASDTGATCRPIVVGAPANAPTTTTDAASSAPVTDDAGAADDAGQSTAVGGDDDGGSSVTTPTGGTVTTSYSYGLCNGDAPAGYVPTSYEYDDGGDDDGGYACSVSRPSSMSESTNAVALAAGVALVLSRSRRRKSRVSR